LGWVTFEKEVFKETLVLELICIRLQPATSVKSCITETPYSRSMTNEKPKNHLNIEIVELCQ